MPPKTAATPAAPAAPAPAPTAAPAELPDPNKFEQRRMYEKALPHHEVNVVALNRGRKWTFAGGYADRDGTHVSAYKFKADGRQRTYKFTMAMILRLMQNKALDVELTPALMKKVREFLGPLATLPTPPKNVVDTLKELEIREKNFDAPPVETTDDEDEDPAEVRAAPLTTQREVVKVEDDAEVKTSKKAKTPAKEADDAE